MLEFKQINLHKAAQASLLMAQDLAGKSEVINLITEPYTVCNKITGMPRGTTLIYDRSIATSRPPPRAAIVGGRSLKLTAMESWCTRDCATALVTLHGKRTMLVSLYMDIKKPVRSPHLDALLNMAHQKGFPVIMGVDSNAHSCLYGPDNNMRGDEMEDLIIQHGLRVENTGLVPTFETRRGPNLIQTHIDVTLTRDLHFDITDWRVSREYNASDHNTVLFEVAEETRHPQRIRPWSKADWTKFSYILKQAEYRVPEGMSMKKLDRLVERLYVILEEALDAACPTVEIIPKVGKDHWSTEKHSVKKQKVTAAYRAAKASKREEDWKHYKQLDKEFKAVCKKDKNKAWRQYKEGLQKTKDMATLARLAQREDRREINTLTKADGTVTDPGKDTIDLLTQTHFPAATDTVRVTYNNRRNCTTDHLMSKYKEWISIPKVKKALLGFEKKKSPGPDEIKPLVFEHLPVEFLAVLEVVYKASIHLAYTPKQWKRTRVIFIAKPGKESYDKPKSFRPISLSNYLLKGLERLVVWNMDRALLANPIHHKQHGFMSGKATESAVSNTVNYIEKHIMQKQHCVGVFLDISSAFDSIRPGHVRQALLDHGGDPEMVQWYFNYISHRDIEISMHDELAKFSTGIGFPQGGVCSAKFWLVAFDYAIKIINRYNIEGNGYADDCSALYGGPRLDHAIIRLQKMLDELTAWGKTCGLNFNPDKSVAVVFSRRHKMPPRPLYIDGRAIEYRNEVKYLGITLDKKLHWTPHINDKISKAKKFITQVAYTTRRNWGPKPQLMRWAFIGVVRPMLCYGSMIWGHRAPELESKLRRINRMAINTFASFPKSTPTRALEILLDLLPLHLFCRQNALATRIRLQDVVEFGWEGSNQNKTHAKSHLKHWQEVMDTHRIIQSHSDRCSAVKWNGGFKVNLDSFSGESKHRTRTQFNIYTDGSKIDEQTGAGFTVIARGKEIMAKHYRLPNHATVFQAEITAIAMAARSIRTMSPPNLKFVKIFIDSQAAIMAVNNPMVTSKAVACAIDELNALAATTTALTLVWIPAHKGHEGNERADTLAKLGARSEDSNAAITVGKPLSTIKQDIKTAVYRDWQKQWLDHNEAHHTKGFYIGPNSSKAKYVYKLARLELGRFVRIITGHNNLNYFQHKLGLAPNYGCRFCGNGNETITHLMATCPRFWEESGKQFANGLPTNDMRWSVRDLLDFSFTPRINEAFEGTWADRDGETVDNCLTDPEGEESESEATEVQTTAE